MDVVFTFLNSPGFGDNLRGLITLLQIQRKMQLELEKPFNIYVNFSKSRIQNYVAYKMPTELSQKIETIKLTAWNFINEYSHDDEIIDFLLNTNEPIVNIQLNAFPDVSKIDEDIKQFIKNLFILSPDFEAQMNKYFDKLPNKYQLFHFRLGDERLRLGEDNLDWGVQSLVNSFKSNYKENENYVIISDSLTFKKQIYEKYKNSSNVFVFLNKPNHTETEDKENEINIFIDFFLITRATSVSCFSVYTWISNFILWSSHIYDVPLINLRDVYIY